MPRFVVVLLGVEHPGNLGAVARAMMNFGFEELALISPKCSPEDEEAQNRAVHAQSILQNAVSGSMELLDQYDLVVGVNGKVGDDYNLRRTPLLPEKLAERLATTDENATIVLLFGRESDGLTNQELDRCDLTVTIPANPAYPSLNLSHAVAVILYELRRGAFDEQITARFPLLRAPERQAMHALIHNLVSEMGFPAEEENKTQEVLWRRLVGKSLMTQREGMALMGFLRRAHWWVKR